MNEFLSVLEDTFWVRFLATVFVAICPVCGVVLCCCLEVDEEEVMSVRNR